MRHGKGLRQLSRTSSHRRALLRNMATSFIKWEHFQTTVQKAKELRPVVEKLITLGKEDTLAARRQAYSYLTDKAVVHKLFADVGPRCKARNGGYTRIVRTSYRHGDAAQLAIIELVDRAGSASESGSKRASSKPKGAAKKAGSKVDEGAKKDKPAKKASAPKKAKAE
jgi:large subunit ribosomal protein L17